MPNVLICKAFERDMFLLYVDATQVTSSQYSASPQFLFSMREYMCISVTARIAHIGMGSHPQ